MKSDLKEKIKFSGIVLLVFIVTIIAYQWQDVYFYLVPTQKAEAVIKKQSATIFAPGQIAFQSSRDWKPSGQAVYLLSNGSIKEAVPGLYPRFIPKINSMVFLKSGIQIYDLATKKAKNLKIRADISPVAGYDISPNGKRIVFVGSVWGKKNGSTIPVENLYVINTDGEVLKQITFFNGKNFFGNPRWSPDGQQILFNMSDHERNKPIDWGGLEEPSPSLYVINVAGTDLKN